MIRRVTGGGKERFLGTRMACLWPGRSLKRKEWLAANLHETEIRFPFPLYSVIFDKIGQCHFWSKNKILFHPQTPRHSRIERAVEEGGAVAAGRGLDRGSSGGAEAGRGEGNEVG